EHPRHSHTSTLSLHDALPICLSCRSEVDSTEDGSHLVQVGLPEEAQRHVPLVGARPAQAANVGPGQGGHLLEHVIRRPHRHEEAHATSLPRPTERGVTVQLFDLRLLRKEPSMAKYLIFGSYTQEGVQGLLKEGGSARRAAVKK